MNFPGISSKDEQLSPVYGHMLLRAEAKGQQLGKGHGFKPRLIDQINAEIISAELPHDLTADPTGREGPGYDAILAAADRDGGKVPVPVVDGLEKGGAFGAVGRAVGGVFDVAALIDGAVGAQQRRADLEAGLGGVGMAHGLDCKFT